jgi:hypothetical protein
MADSKNPKPNNDLPERDWNKGEQLPSNKNQDEKDRQKQKKEEEDKNRLRESQREKEKEWEKTGVNPPNDPDHERRNRQYPGQAPHIINPDAGDEKPTHPINTPETPVSTGGGATAATTNLGGESFKLDMQQWQASDKEKEFAAQEPNYVEGQLPHRIGNEALMSELVKTNLDTNRLVTNVRELIAKTEDPDSKDRLKEMEASLLTVK